MNPSATDITVNSRKFDGSIRRSWNAELVHVQTPLVELVGRFVTDVEHSELGFIQKGTISHEYYWLDRWHNIFRFHQPSGTFRNYYCNLTMPPKFSGDVLDFVDLDIDVLVWPDGKVDVLDIDDFEHSSQRFGYSEDLINKVHTELNVLLRIIDRKELPRLDTQNIAADREIQPR